MSSVCSGNSKAAVCVQVQVEEEEGSRDAAQVRRCEQGRWTQPWLRGGHQGVRAKEPRGLS